jgi:hypothetical protein
MQPAINSAGSVWEEELTEALGISTTMAARTFATGYVRATRADSSVMVGVRTFAR